MVGRPERVSPGVRDSLRLSASVGHYGQVVVDSFHFSDNVGQSCRETARARETRNNERKGNESERVSATGKYILRCYDTEYFSSERINRQTNGCAHPFSSSRRSS